MIYGLYLSSQGAQTESARLDVLANNLANASTSSFKRDLAIVQSHEPFDAMHGRSSTMPGNLQEATGGTSLAEVVTDFTVGPLQPTGGNLDIALAGPGFFKVRNERGEFLTRDGRLSITDDGTLVTAGGHQVLDTAGNPIEVAPQGGKITIRFDGSITQTTEEETLDLGTMDIVEPASYGDLQKVANNLYRNLGSESPAGPEVILKQGFLEASGVNPINEMMALISASRAFEANVNMIKYQEETLGQLLSTVPRL